MTQLAPARSPRRRGVRLLVLSAFVALQGCIVLPQTQQVYDPDCHTLTRRMTLETAVLGTFQSCAGDACVAMLAAAGAVTAASMVISGSIVLVGNVVYWFERQGQCARMPPTEPAVTGPRPAA